MASKKPSQREEEHETLMRVIFGDEQTGEKGMKEKVDEIHQMIVQVNGVGSFLKWIIVIGASLAAVKLWLIK